MNGPDIKDFDAARYARAWIDAGHKKTGDVTRSKKDKPSDTSKEPSPDDMVFADTTTEDDYYARTYLAKPLLF